MTTFAYPLKNPALFRTDSFINGEWTAADDNNRFTVNNPLDGALLAHVANVGVNETQRAIAAAEKAWFDWRARTAKERANLMRRWYELIIQHQDDLATLMTAEQGKPLAESRGEVGYGASFIEWFAEEAKRVDGDVLSTTSSNLRYLVLKQPVGVCAAITPWNFPLAMITRKAAPALAAGCTIVIKPAEQTPLTALAMTALAQEAGIPNGVLNVVTGDGKRSIEIGNTFCESPTVRKLSFTGSTEVGRILMKQCAPTIKKLSLELGGQAPFIVFDDADLDAAVNGAMQAKYRNAGQTCVCANRFYVQEPLYDAFVEKLTQRSREIRVGSGFEKGVQQGPLIDDAAIEKVEQHVADATSKGATILTGGKRASLGARFYEPTVLANVSSNMRVMQEETFGPVAPVQKFRDDNEAIALANDTIFGLAGYFYSSAMKRIWRVAEALEYGMVGVNTGLISNEFSPFGGVKQSGLGREGSKYGIDEYLELKYVCLGGL